MPTIKHILSQPFIAATGLAAFIHSTWALATLFSGEPPSGELNGVLLAKLAYWLVPAMLIAFALDVGQLSTSYDIRTGNKTFSKYLTFGVFSVSNYLLQWLFIAHHMPALELADGVRSEWLPLATLLRDASLWFIPLLLPLSSLLYTLSGEPSELNAAQLPLQARQTASEPPKRLSETPQLEPSASLALLPTVIQTELEPSVSVSCEYCGEWSGVYDTAKQAAQAKRAHHMHCSKKQAVSVGGNGHHALSVGGES